MTLPRPDPRPAADMGGGSSPPTSVGSGLSDHDPDAPIEDLHLSMRGYNILRRSRLTTVGRILRRSEEELLSLRNFSQRCYDELRARLDERGILPRSNAWPSSR